MRKFANALLNACLVALVITLTVGQLRAADQNVVVVLDDSGSMDDRMANGDRRIDAAKNALREVLANLPPETQVGILTLNSSVERSNWIVPFGPADPERWRSRIEAIQANGGTPLGEFLKVGADQLLDARSLNVYGDYRLLVVTDGEANDKRLVDAYLPDILSRGLVVDVIGVDMQADHSLATLVHNYRRADDAESLTRAVAEVFAETSPDDSNAEEDFELLAALPDELAAEALKALTQRGNEPIGGSGGPNSPQIDLENALGNSGGDSVGEILGGIICCVGGLGLVVILLVIIISGLKSGRRR